MYKRKIVVALMSLALGTSSFLPTVAYAEGNISQNNVLSSVEEQNNNIPTEEQGKLNYPEETTVYYNGQYYKTIVDGLKAAYMDKNTKGIKEIHCKPGADVGSMTHGHVADDLIIYGNGAKVSGGEYDLEIDTYKYSRDTGLQVSDKESDLEKEITVTVKDLDGIAAWGQRKTTHTINLNFENCHSMNRIYFSGTSGDININVNGCSFDSTKTSHKDTSIYSNANGTINVNNTTFNKIDVGLNLNHKIEGTQTISIKNSEFKDCGLGINESTKTYAAPIRIVAKEGAISNLSVEKAKFYYSDEKKISLNGDVLLGDGRHNADEIQGITTLAMKNTTANVMTQKSGFYNAEGKIEESSNGTKTEVSKDDVLKPDENEHFKPDKNDEPEIPVYPSIPSKPEKPEEPITTEIIGSDRYETSAMIADQVGDYDTVILVNGDKYLADGLSASSLAGKENAPILLVKENSIPAEILSRIQKAKKVYIIGGTAAISKDVESKLSEKEVTRIEGKDRVETSEKVAKLVGNYDSAFIVNGNVGEADAISVASIAARDNAPIILTNGKTSTHNKKADAKYYVVGGDAVVSNSIVSKFGAERLSGDDRYKTNRVVVQKFYPNAEKYYYTKGDVLVDALAVSPLSKNDGVVLVSPKSDNSILKDKDRVQVGGMDFNIN